MKSINYAFAFLLVYRECISAKPDLLNLYDKNSNLDTKKLQEKVESNSDGGKSFFADIHQQLGGRIENGSLHIFSESSNYLLINDLGPTPDTVPGPVPDPVDVKWREDLRCGSEYPLPSGKPSECNPNRDHPCCNIKGWCENVPEDLCDCDGCIDYRKGPEEIIIDDVKWRDDLRCGSDYPLPSGNPSECDPNGVNPCCSDGSWCGRTTYHCHCNGCIDFRSEADKQLDGDVKWREDLRCGADYLLPSGEPSECNPYGIYPCCSDGNWCGNTQEHCLCQHCVDFRHPEAVSVDIKWRKDLSCGYDYPLPSGKPSECNPYGDKPCCSAGSFCGNTTEHCECEGCIDYRIRSEQPLDIEVKWREDLRCGSDYPLPSGEPSQCNPYGIYPCCSDGSWCGRTQYHCDCAYCIDYRYEAGSGEGGSGSGDGGSGSGDGDF